MEIPEIKKERGEPAGLITCRGDDTAERILARVFSAGAARWSGQLQVSYKEVVQQEDRVGDVDRSVIVGIS
jgi:hypothetical protein